MALMSCNEKTVNVQEMPEQAGTVELKVKVPAASTRLTGEAADEDKISNLQVFVFNESDALEAYGNEDAESLSLTCVPGKKQVVALVNAPSLSDISKLSDLQAEISYLSDNEAGALVMASDVLDKELLAEGDLHGEVRIFHVLRQLRRPGVGDAELVRAVIDVLEYLHHLHTGVLLPTKDGERE